MRGAVERCGLDLSNFVVLTEAASGAYVVTPVLAALAGANVIAFTRSTRHGSTEEVAEATIELATEARVNDRILIATDWSQIPVGQADVITNSGHIRPIDSLMISRMRRTAVIPLMYEAWEFRDGDVDLAACRKRGVRVVGTNERHPAVNVFSFLGMMSVRLLLDAGLSVFSNRVLVVCNNSFGAFIKEGLISAGAYVILVSRVSEAPTDTDFDAVLVAVTPTGKASLSDTDVELISLHWSRAVVAVYWGDVDRGVLGSVGLAYWPVEAPPAGHMGVLPSAIGPEPIVRLQCGSLKAAEAVLRYSHDTGHPDHQFGQAL